MGNIPAGDWLTVQEVATLWGVDKRQVLRYIKDGRLPATKIGQAFVVLRADADAFERAPRGRPAASDPAPSPVEAAEPARARGKRK